MHFDGVLCRCAAAGPREALAPSPAAGGRPRATARHSGAARAVRRAMADARVRESDAGAGADGCAGVNYHSQRDFEWAAAYERVVASYRQGLADAFAAGRRLPKSLAVPLEGDGDARAADAPVEHMAAQAGLWDAFYVRQGTGRAYKERRYLLECFEPLKRARAVLELGCGHGSAALPILRHNAAAAVRGVDLSAQAVSQANDEMTKEGFPAERFAASVGDVSDVAWRPPPPPGSESCEGAANAGASDGAYDCVLLVFTLNAVPPDRAAAVFANAYRALAPGGALLFRDYGLGDVRHVRCLKAVVQDRGNDVGGERGFGEVPTCFVKHDGTHTRFFSLEGVAAMAAEAGFLAAGDEFRYGCVHNVNRKTGIEWDRINITAIWRKPGEP